MLMVVPLSTDREKNQRTHVHAVLIVCILGRDTQEGAQSLVYDIYGSHK